MKRGLPRFTIEDSAIEQVGTGKLDYAAVVTDGQSISYTAFACDRQISSVQASILLGCIFMVAGMIQGYQQSIVLILQENGATYKEQSYFNLVFIPFTCKVVFGPLIDLVYIKRLGKCKTWIVFSALSIFILLIAQVLAGSSDLVPANIKVLIFTWAAINLVVVFLQIAAEVMIVKVFHSVEDKAKGAGLTLVGMEIGVFIGMNLFVPLNDKEWLNSHLFTSSPLTRPLITNDEFVIFIACFTLAIGIITVLFVAEKQSEKYQESNYIKEYFKSLPKFFTLRSMQMLLLWIFSVRWFSCMVQESLLLKLIDLGIKKTYIVNIKSITFPLIILFAAIAVKLIRKSYILKFAHFQMLYLAILLYFDYYILLDLRSNKNQNRTKIHLLVKEILYKAFTQMLLFQAYVNTVTTQEHGSTFITLILNCYNLTKVWPTTLGLWIVGIDSLPYDTFVAVCFIVQAIILVASFPLAQKLDTFDKYDFDFSGKLNEERQNLLDKIDPKSTTDKTNKQMIDAKSADVR